MDAVPQSRSRHDGVGDRRPRSSGYQTNFAILSAADIGLAPATLLDGVRIDACCGNRSDFDLLAVATVGTTVAVPEPTLPALFGSGLLALAFLRRRRGLVSTR